MLHQRRTRRVRTRLTAGTAGAAWMLQRLRRKRSDERCTKSRRRSREGGRASHLAGSPRLPGLEGAVPSPPSRRSICSPAPREEDPTSSGPTKRRRSSLVGRHVGLGGIRYHFVARSPSDLQEARAEASIRRRPVIVFAQNPPSSSSKQANDAFSHPLVAEAIECLFVAVATADPACLGDPPKGKKDTAVRIVWDEREGGPYGGAKEAKRDVLVPFDGLSVGTVTTAMVSSLQELRGGGRVVPPYLRLLAKEEGGGTTQRRTALFGSPCSRRAEIELAKLDGVVATQAGRVDSRRVVSVVYDAGRVSFGGLVQFALEHISIEAVFYQMVEERIGAQIELQREENLTAEILPFPETVRRDVVSSKAALRSTCLCCVPLTELQSTRANQLIDAGRFHEAVRLLSPRQGRMLMKSVQSTASHTKFQESIGVPIRNAWKCVEESGALDDSPK